MNLKQFLAEMEEGFVGYVKQDGTERPRTYERFQVERIVKAAVKMALESLEIPQFTAWEEGTRSAYFQEGRDDAIAAFQAKKESLLKEAE